MEKEKNTMNNDKMRNVAVSMWAQKQENTALRQRIPGVTLCGTCMLLFFVQSMGQTALFFDGIDDQVLFGDAIPPLGHVFTVECFFKWYGGTDSWQAILERQEWGRQEWGIIIGGPGSGYEGEIDGAFTYDGDHGNAHYISGPFTINDSLWHHVALVGTGSEIVVYLDGQRGNAERQEGPLGAVDDVEVSAGSLMNPYEFFNGCIDEIRISSTARYGGQRFDVPQQPFSADQYTIALWHCDEESGDSVFDSSGREYHGVCRQGVRRTAGYPFVPVHTFSILPHSAASFSLRGGQATIRWCWKREGGKSPLVYTVDGHVLTLCGRRK